MSLGSPSGLGLEADAHPAVGVVVALVTLGGDGVGEHEKGGAVAPLGGEAFAQELVFVVEHEREALARHVAGRLAVDGVAEGHVVGGDGLGDGAGGAARLEEHARDLLAGADFREGAVLGIVEIDREGLAAGGEQVLLFAHGRAAWVVRPGAQPVRAAGRWVAVTFLLVEPGKPPTVRPPFA
jgi:hypothetical protein